MSLRWIIVLGITAASVVAPALPATGSDVLSRPLPERQAATQSPLEFTPPDYRLSDRTKNRFEKFRAPLNTAQAWKVVGRRAVRTGDYHNALVAYDKAVDLSMARSPEILEERGWLHYLQGNHEQAIADLDTAADLYLNQLYLGEDAVADYVNVRQMYQFVETVGNA